jgi:hypothetical protein
MGGGSVFSTALRSLMVAGRIFGKTGHPNLVTTGKIALAPHYYGAILIPLNVCHLLHHSDHSLKFFHFFAWFHNHYVPPNPEQQQMGEIIDNPRLHERRCIHIRKAGKPDRPQVFIRFDNFGKNISSLN